MRFRSIEADKPPLTTSLNCLDSSFRRFVQKRICLRSSINFLDIEDAAVGTRCRILDWAVSCRADCYPGKNGLFLRALKTRVSERWKYRSVSELVCIGGCLIESCCFDINIICDIDVFIIYFYSYRVEQWFLIFLIVWKICWTSKLMIKRTNKNMPRRNKYILENILLNIFRFYILKYIIKFLQSYDNNKKKIQLSQFRGTLAKSLWNIG